MPINPQADYPACIKWLADHSNCWSGYDLRGQAGHVYCKNLIAMMEQAGLLPFDTHPAKIPVHSLIKRAKQVLLDRYHLACRNSAMPTPPNFFNESNESLKVML